MYQQKPQILIVEDERLIAHSIQRALLSAGYEVSGISSSAFGAISILETNHTDLVLMDIRIQGDMDGVDTAKLIGERFHLPVIYLTAHADEPTLKRAKITSPFGYLMKPVNYGQLQSSIEVALHKHKVERQLEEHRALLASILKSIPEAVIVTGPEGRVRFMNEAAERLTEWQQGDAAGLEIGEVAPLASPNGTMESWVHRALNEKQTVQLPRETKLSARLGRDVPVEGNIALITAGERSAGSVVTLQDATFKLREEQQIRQEQNMLVLGQFASNLSGDFHSLLGLISDCARDLIASGRQNGEDLEAVTTISQASKAAGSLAGQLNELGRQGALRPEPVLLTEAVVGLQPLLARLAGEGLRLEFALDPATGSVFIHPNQLDQLLIHLVLNARHSIAPGTGTIAISTSSGRLREEIDSVVKLLVRAIPDSQDTHFTIRPDFLMADPEVSFTIVNAIVAVAGGFAATSEDSNGAVTTEIHLPQSAGAVRIAAARSRRTVMTVGLDLELAEFIHRQLEEDQYLVLEAPGVSEARLISELYDSNIDISVVDIDLIGERASEGLRVSLLARFPNTKFIYLAGQKTIPRKTGENLILSKPFSLGSLSRAIGNILGKSATAMHA